MQNDRRSNMSDYDILSIYADQLMSVSRDELLNTLVEPTSTTGYYDYESMTNRLRELHRNYSSITSLYSIGKSDKQRDLWTMIISDRPLIHEVGEPEVRYIGNIHDDERVSRECLIRLVEYLCLNYGTNDYITRLIDNV
jgi:hypothetical protein